MITKNNSNEIKIIRVYDYPVKMVWEAWTDSNQAAMWWGPRGFTITTHSKDLRPGGNWNYTMHGPDGVNYPNITKYFEVEKYVRLVYDHGANETQPALFRVDVKFIDLISKTRMEMTMTVATPEAAIEISKFIKAANGNSTWDRLAEHLEKSDTEKEIFIINRTFATNINHMYQLWTEPQHLSKWLPPTGFECQFSKFDFRQGGQSEYCMFGSDFKMYGALTYNEIEKPHRLVYTQHFSDEKGSISRHPMAPTWPEKMQTTVTFAAEGEDLTRVTVKWEVVGNYTAEELATFVAGRAGMTMGWGGSFEKLENYLGKSF